MNAVNQNRLLTLAVIPARGGSRGVPRKNLRLVGGKPLVAHAIECGLACREIDDVMVSTEDGEIADVARKYGAHVPFLRPQELARDDTSMLAVLQHVVASYEDHSSKRVDVIVLLDPTGPLRLPNDVEESLKLLKESNADAVISGNLSHRNPYFNMVEEREGYLSLSKNHTRSISRRQDAPPVYDLNTVVWIYTRGAIMEEKARLPRKTRLYLVPPERSVDLDGEEDFRLLEYLITSRERKVNAGSS